MGRQQGLKWPSLKGFTAKKEKTQAETLEEQLIPPWEWRADIAGQ